MDDATMQATSVQKVRAVINRLVQSGQTVADDGTTHTIFPIAINPDEGDVLRSWVTRENAKHTIEIGLAYGLSALYICEGLVAIGQRDIRHVAIDPFQLTSFAGCGLQALAAAGLSPIIEHHAEKSHVVLPQMMNNGRTFDLAFVDGNHRFDSVFLDLYYLGQMMRRGGIIILDDYDLPGIKKAVAFYVADLNWTVEEVAEDWVVLRTATTDDDRHFTYFVDF